MGQKRRKFLRSVGERPYKKLFILAVEGIKTEPQYFSIFNNQNSVIRVTCLKSGPGSSPLQVLKRMEAYLQKEQIRSSDEAWLVVDKDQWTDEQLGQLHEWAQTQDNYGFALSNPMFEYWLLLHFEDGNGISTTRECSERLKRQLSDYDKGIDPRKFTDDKIQIAISHAQKRDQPPCTDWPRDPGSTTVYRLVEKLILVVLATNLLPKRSGRTRRSAPTRNLLQKPYRLDETPLADTDFALPTGKTKRSGRAWQPAPTRNLLRTPFRLDDTPLADICVDHWTNETFRVDTAVRPYAEFVANPVSVG